MLAVIDATGMAVGFVACSVNKTVVSGPVVVLAAAPEPVAAGGETPGGSEVGTGTVPEGGATAVPIEELVATKVSAWRT